MGERAFRIFTVDAFTGKPFGGNPAAVVLLRQLLPQGTLQNIAAEMNLSVTAFLTPVVADDSQCPWAFCSKFGLRWLTPTVEIKLCGHATLASAHVLFNCLGNCHKALEFETLAGVLVARKKEEQIILDFPLHPPSPLTPRQESSFKSIIDTVGRTRVSEVLVSIEGWKLLVVLDKRCSREDLEALAICPEDLHSLHDGSEFKVVIVTLEGELHSGSSVRGLKEYNFVTRCFTPWIGIPEDPVTGSAQSVLGPYWAEKLRLRELKCHQCSKRGGDLELLVRDDGRIDLRGKAVAVLEGTINI